MIVQRKFGIAAGLLFRRPHARIRVTLYGRTINGHPGNSIPGLSFRL